MEMVSGNTGAVAFEPAGSSSPRPAPPFQCNETNETTSRREKDVLKTMAILAMTYVAKGEERER